MRTDFYGIMPVYPNGKTVTDEFSKTVIRND